ncbi:hypothetical protein BURPS406E_D0881 [Burkholderia pseudomallei 406e]|nr:hypothetical protein BURPS406E_D0881 [Burkholderia pseudomallei 406e]
MSRPKPTTCARPIVVSLPAAARIAHSSPIATSGSGASMMGPWMRRGCARRARSRSGSPGGLHRARISLTAHRSA